MLNKSLHFSFKILSFYKFNDSHHNFNTNRYLTSSSIKKIILYTLYSNIQGDYFKGKHSFSQHQ